MNSPVSSGIVEVSTSRINNQDSEVDPINYSAVENSVLEEFNSRMNLEDADIETGGDVVAQVAESTTDEIQAHIGSANKEKTGENTANGDLKPFEPKVAKIPEGVPRIPTDRQGRLLFTIFDRLGEYQITGHLGQGSFGDVAIGKHVQKRSLVAIKVNIHDVRDSENCEAEYEAFVLEKLTNLDKSDKFPFIKLLEKFEYNKHICLVTKVHGVDLWTYQINNRDKPFSMRILKWISIQAFRALDFLHSNKVIHCDIKGDNLLFDSVLTKDVDIDELTIKRARIRLVDFGASVNYSDKDLENTKNERSIQPFAYRAPEVFFGMGWNSAVDIWSLACVLFEFYNPCYKKVFLNETHNNLRIQLKIMEILFGKFPTKFTEDENAELFDESGYILLEEWQKHKINPFHYGPLELYKVKKNEIDTNLFFDLLTKMTEHDPAQRITAKNALVHPFFDSIQEIYLSEFES